MVDIVSLAARGGFKLDFKRIDGLLMSSRCSHREKVAERRCGTRKRRCLIAIDRYEGSFTPWIQSSI